MKVVIFVSDESKPRQCNSKGLLGNLRDILIGDQGLTMHWLKNSWLHIYRNGQLKKGKIKGEPVYKQTFINNLDSAPSIEQYFPTANTASNIPTIDYIFLILWKTYFKDPNDHRHCILVFDSDALATKVRDEIKSRQNELPPLTHVEIANNISTKTSTQRLRSMSAPSDLGNRDEPKPDKLPQQNKRKVSGFWVKLRSLFTPRVTTFSLISKLWSRRPNWLMSRKARTFREENRIKALINKTLTRERQQAKEWERKQTKERRRAREQELTEERRQAQEQKLAEERIQAREAKHIYSPYSPIPARLAETRFQAKLTKERYNLGRKTGELDSLYTQGKLPKTLFKEIASYTDTVCESLTPCLIPRRSRIPIYKQETLSMPQRSAIIKQLAELVIKDDKANSNLKKHFILYVYNVYLNQIKSYKEEVRGSKKIVPISAVRKNEINTLIDWCIRHIDGNNTFNKNEQLDYIQAVDDVLKELTNLVETVTERRDLEAMRSKLTTLLNPRRSRFFPRKLMAGLSSARSRWRLFRTCRNTAATLADSPAPTFNI